jgi:hypothetical protein
MFRTSTTLFLVATILTCVASNASAQWYAYKSQPRTMSVSKAHSEFMGNAYLGGSIYSGARLSAQKVGGRAQAHSSYFLYTYAKFLNHNKRMASIRSSARSDNYTSSRNSGSVWVYLGDNLILNRTLSRRGSHSVTFQKTSLDLFPKDLAEPFSIVGIPITVRGNVGVGTRIDTQQILRDGRVTFGGYVKTWGYLNITATCGVRGAYAQALTRDDLAKPILNASTNVDAVNWRFSARVLYSVKAITLLLRTSVTHIWTRRAMMTFWKGTAKSISLLRL